MGNSLAAAPPAIVCKVGVSTSKNLLDLDTPYCSNPFTPQNKIFLTSGLPLNPHTVADSEFPRLLSHAIFLEVDGDLESRSKSQ